ncbi:MAG: hypothetical protein RXQ70_00150 [Sulfolobaceae archaeon]|nr:hypothetical protein [Sulfolobales archaeon]
MTYVCKSCGREIFSFKKVGQDFYGIRTPSEIKAMFGGKCPYCGHELSVPDLNDIVIRPRIRS